MLAEVKKLLGGITGTFQDDILESWIAEIQQLMINGGIDESIATATTSAGVIAKGIDDVYFQKTELSNYFWQRATQLALTEVEEDEQL